MTAVGITENVKGDQKKFEIWYSGREEVYVVQVGRLCLPFIEKWAPAGGRPSPFLLSARLPPWKWRPPGFRSSAGSWLISRSCSEVCKPASSLWNAKFLMRMLATRCEGQRKSSVLSAGVLCLHHYLWYHFLDWRRNMTNFCSPCRHFPASQMKCTNTVTWRDMHNLLRLSLTGQSEVIGLFLCRHHCTWLQATIAQTCVAFLFFALFQSLVSN